MRLRGMSTSVTRTRHHVARLDHLVRVLHEPVGQLADMDETVLMHADIDEGAEGRDVGHGAFQHHAGFQILDVLDAVGEGRRS